MRPLFLIAAFILFGGILYTAPAQAGLLEFLFPTLQQKEPDPAVTLQAPFARDPEEQNQPYIPGSEKQAEAQPLPENMIPLEQPHRNQLQIAEWLGPIAAEAMTFTSEDPQTDFDAIRPYFDENGFALYQKFLQTHKVQNVLDLNKYSIRAYVKDTPLLLNQAPVAGRYHWLYEVPVMVSYLDRSKASYDGADPVNQQFILRVQVGRSEKAPNAMGLIIDHWDGKSVKLDKK